MKKIILFSMMLTLAVTMPAQHVTPIAINLTPVQLDTLRAQYKDQPQAYLMELRRLDDLLKSDTKALKDAQLQLKAEREFHKQLNGYIDKAETSFKNLLSVSQKELDEMNKLKENMDGQLRFLNSTSLLNNESRSKATSALQEQRKEMEAGISAAMKRQTELNARMSELQKMRTDLMVLNGEVINKETDLKQLEITLKHRRDIIKEETKIVKSQK